MVLNEQVLFAEDDAHLGEVQGANALVALGNPRRAGTLAYGLQRHGILPTLVFSKAQILGCLQGDGFRLLVADDSLVTPDFWTLIRATSARARLAIISLRATEEDCREMPPVGVDVCLSRTAPLDDVVRHATSLIRMSNEVLLPHALRFGPLELDMRTREARWRREIMALTPIQFRIMEILVLAAGEVVTARDISRHLWGDSDIDETERVVAHIRRIRKKIESDPSNPRFLTRVRGEGFRLIEHAREPHAI